MVAYPAELFAGYNPVVPPVSQTIRVNVLFFGQLKEFLGCAQESIELPHGSSIQDLFQHLASRNPDLQKFRNSLVASRNQEFAAWRTSLQAGDEVAFLPPVSGG
jgi:molybdopterin converting factor subunit 1